VCNYTTYTNQELKNHLIVQHAEKNVGSNNLETHILFIDAQKDQMCVSIEKYAIVFFIQSK
jgi:hypothetical protein